MDEKYNVASKAAGVLNILTTVYYFTLWIGQFLQDMQNTGQVSRKKSKVV